MRPYFLFLLFKRIRAIGYLMRDPQVSFYKKALVVFGIIYLISPIDLIPFPVLGFSVIDDMALWAFILSFLKEQLDQYDPKSKKQSFKGKKIIDSVAYEVKKEDDEK